MASMSQLNEAVDAYIDAVLHYAIDMLLGFSADETWSKTLDSFENSWS